MELHMEYYLVISTIMLFAGIYGFITRRNLLAVLISIELILNSVDINFAIAIIINIYRNIRNIQVKNLNELKEESKGMDN